ncbi:hypothetical protein [Magnetospirillum fulvum]|uniref:Uncharacterized protein n=1 Tax=Magnetospirillum fulvum MGU-K5 TaxID=1316936 RepID=S9SBB1_MAGFU|nr:hypothetical protein [Magnetospirillum fulvum]EPY01383.1 hypothetical protein K678_11316 [Magnetospirillum fulvum MGU-K5]
MRVRVNPAFLAENSDFQVLHPVTRRPFPAPDPFELSDPDVKTPLIRRLLPPLGQPGGVEGGVFGDLIQVTEALPVAKPAPQEV